MRVIGNSGEALTKKRAQIRPITSFLTTTTVADGSKTFSFISFLPVDTYHVKCQN
jgi:hypothetical protein